ncbi:MAG: putative hydrolase of the HAD superfamily [Marinobacter excellens HL-55]|uniref:Putative hydrolase of the HAD superfamily n=1 Tax=Marinobacter excellens HL-55 TaxID=1305731 RepID=A0A0P7YZ88_9GAMM|nr:MAG: putative hydrolase of the HAD superfamily [Marinobacter excellens HL-55]
MVNWSILDTVFLDMDGTLLDLHFDSHFWLEHLPKRYAEQYDLNPQQAKESLVAMIMAERGSLNWYCTDYWSEKLSVDINRLKAEVSDRIGYRPHVPDFLAGLRRAGLRSVIVTNCHPDPLALKLNRTGLDKHVDAIISSHELGKPKEDHDFWRDLGRKIRYRQDHTLMVDDSFPVLESARRAGMGQCLAILAPDSQQAPSSHHPEIPGIHHFDEVLPSLQSHRPLPS